MTEDTTLRNVFESEFTEYHVAEDKEDDELRSQSTSLSPSGDDGDCGWIR